MFSLYMVIVAFTLLSLHFVGTSNRKAFKFTMSVTVGLTLLFTVISIVEWL